MRLMILLTTVLSVMACGKKGSNSDAGASAQAGLSGSYEYHYQLGGVGAHLQTIKFGGGVVEALLYYFPNGPADFTAAYFRKSSGTYTVNGNSYTVNWTFETCGALATEVWTIDTVDADTIKLSGIGVTYNADSIPSVNQFLSNIGNVAAGEDVNCNKVP